MTTHYLDSEHSSDDGIKPLYTIQNQRLNDAMAIFRAGIRIRTGAWKYTVGSGVNRSTHMADLGRCPVCKWSFPNVVMGNVTVGGVPAWMLTCPRCIKHNQEVQEKAKKADRKLYKGEKLDTQWFVPRYMLPVLDGFELQSLAENQDYLSQGHGWV